MEVSEDGEAVSLISVKPESFYHNFLQYEDVFAGLQYVTEIMDIRWKIFYRYGETISSIELTDLSASDQERINTAAKAHR